MILIFPYRTSYEEIKAVIKKASESGPLKGIMGYTEDEVNFSSCFCVDPILLFARLCPMTLSVMTVLPSLMPRQVLH